MLLLHEGCDSVSYTVKGSCVRVLMVVCNISRHVVTYSRILILTNTQNTDRIGGSYPVQAL